MGAVTISQPLQEQTIGVGEVFTIKCSADGDTFLIGGIGGQHTVDLPVVSVSHEIVGGTILSFSPDPDAPPVNSQQAVRNYKGTGVATAPGTVRITVTAVAAEVGGHGGGSNSASVTLRCVGDNLQLNWRFCGRCQGLWFAGGPASSCPAGGQHSKDPSFNYALHRTPAAGQENWRYCFKCQGLWFAGNTNVAPCPAGGSHTKRISDNYVLKSDPVSGGEQDNWRFCNKCQGLWSAWSPGRCPGFIDDPGEGHDGNGSFNYSLIAFAH